jgi:DNA-binding NtrC family response regulator
VAQARTAKARILVVDDEQNARQALRTILTEEGYELAEASDGAEALEQLSGFSPDVVLSDVRMPRMDGITFLKNAREQGSQAVFVMMTAFASIETAVEAMRAGAETYLIKPLDVKAVLVVLEKALEKRRLVQETELLRARVRERFRFPNIVGESPELQSVFEVIKQAARRGPSRGRLAEEKVGSSWLTGGHFSWTKSARFPHQSKSSCCVSFNSASSSAWVERRL